MSKTQYKPNGEVELWNWFNSNQSTDDTFDAIGKRFGISPESAKKLHLLWASGAKDSFNQAYFSLFEGSPTKFE